MTETPKDGARRTLERIGKLLDKHDTETQRRIVETLALWLGIVKLGPKTAEGDKP